MKIEQLFSVRGKVALVTGGSRGLGEMMARAYVENGAKVYITARKADALRGAGEWNCRRSVNASPFLPTCRAWRRSIASPMELRKREKRPRHPRQQCRCELGGKLCRIPRDTAGTR